MLKKFSTLIKKQAFKPSGFFGILINPYFFSRRAIFREVDFFSQTFTGKTIDIGCGTKPYRDLFHVSDYVGIEVADSYQKFKSHADVFYDGTIFPFQSGFFDHAISFQVLEHVVDANLFISEVSRLLRSDGTLLLSVPFIWEEHEVPNDRLRYTSYGICELLEKHGFKVLKIKKLCVGMEALIQKATSIITASVANKPKLVKYVTQLMVVAPIHIVFYILIMILPKYNRIYLDNMVLAVKN
jgi:SAM-dependent methyltransferase